MKVCIVRGEAPSKSGEPPRSFASFGPGRWSMSCCCDRVESCYVTKCCVMSSREIRGLPFAKGNFISPLKNKVPLESNLRISRFLLREWGVGTAILQTNRPQTNILRVEIPGALPVFWEYVAPYDEDFRASRTCKQAGCYCDAMK